MVQPFGAIFVSLLLSSVSEPVRQHTWTTAGPPGVAVVVTTDPVDASNVYSATTLVNRSSGEISSSAFRSVTGGMSWFEIGRAPPNFRIEALVVDPNEPDVLFAAANAVTSFGAPVPPGNIYRSFDRGVIWNLVRTLSSAAIKVLVVDTHGTGTIYAAGGNNCVPAPCLRGAFFKSRDQGTSWDELGSGLSTFIGALAVDPIRSEVIYAASTTGVYKSIDGGASWILSSAGLESCSNNVTALAVNPMDPDVLYAGVYAAAFNDTGCMAIFRTVNGGATWERTGAPRAHVARIAIDPTNPGTLYAGAVMGTQFFSPPPSVLRSTDGGASWTPLKGGLPISASVNDLALGPFGLEIHAATSVGVFEYQLEPRRGSPLTAPFRR